MKLAHRTIQNALFNVGGWIMPLVTSFVFTPYIVRTMGASGYGILTLVWSVIGYFTFLDLGLGSAVTKFVAEHNGRDDARGANHSIGAAILVSGGLGLLGGIAIYVLADVFTTRCLKVPEAMHASGILAFRIGAAGFVVGMFNTMCRAVLRGLNRYDVTSLVSVLSSVASTAGTAALLWLGRQLPAIVLLNVAVPLAATLIYAIMTPRVRPGIHVAPITSRKALRQMLHFGLFTMLSRAAYAALRHFDRIVVAAILGVSAVTYYVVPTTLVTRASGLTMEIASVIFPAISELQGQARQEVVAELYLTAVRVMTAISTAICVPLLVFGCRLLSLWMGPAFAQQAGVVIVLVALGYYCDSITGIPCLTADGMGRPDVTGLSSVSITVIYFALMVPFAHWWGINGVAVAGVLCTAIVAPVFTWYVTRRIVGIPLSRMFRESMAGPYGLGVLFTLLLLLVPRDRITNVVAMLGVMGLSALAYLAVAIPTGVFAAPERRAIVGYLRVMQAKLK